MYNTQRNVRTEINKFLEYMGNKDLFFAHVTVKLLTDYESWLRIKKGKIGIHTGF